MKILIVARGYPTNKYRLNGIFEFDQAKALSAAGVEVVYIALDVRSILRWRKWGIEKKIIDGIKIYAINIPCGNIPKKIRNIISILALRKIYKVSTEESGIPDLIHSHFISIGYIVAKAFYNLDIPLILTEHNSEINQKKISSYYQKIGEFTYSRMDQIIAVSKYLANNIKDKFDVDVIIIPNIVDLSNFKYEIDYGLRKNKYFSFVSVGRLHPDKGMDLLIDSFYKAFKGENDVYLYIYGDGIERSKLEKKVNELKLKKQVFLLGLADRKAISNQMNESDCFVLVSKLETFGVSYIEAMAKGLPVISTKCGGPEEFINDQNGILVGVNNEKELELELRRMTLNISKYDRKEISNSTINKFSGGNVANKLVNSYDEILKTRNR